jgi:hypothetical protein
VRVLIGWASTGKKKKNLKVHLTEPRYRTVIPILAAGTEESQTITWWLNMDVSISQSAASQTAQKQFDPLGLEYSMELGDTSITGPSATSPPVRNSNWLQLFPAHAQQTHAQCEHSQVCYDFNISSKSCRTAQNTSPNLTDSNYVTQIPITNQPPHMFCDMTLESRNSEARCSIARQRLGKHIPAATNKQSIQDKCVYSLTHGADENFLRSRQLCSY